MRDNLIVYGSLINKKELFDVFDYVTENEAIPIRLNGFKRVFNQEMVWRNDFLKMNSMIELIARPTEDRKGVQGEYVIQLNPKILNKVDKAKVGSHFLVGRAHKERALWTFALLQAVNEAISEDEIRIDQTLRTAIGAKEGDLKILLLLIGLIMAFVFMLIEMRKKIAS